MNSVVAAPLVVSDAPPLWILVLLRELRDDVAVRLGPSTGLDLTGTAPGPLFLYSPSSHLLSAARVARPDLRLCVSAGDAQLWCDRP